MNEIEKKANMVDATDCLEAVTAVRSMKNFLFTVALFCLLLLQLAFWANYLGYIDKTDCPLGAASNNLPTLASCTITVPATFEIPGISEVLMVEAVIIPDTDTEAPADTDPAPEDQDIAAKAAQAIEETAPTETPEPEPIVQKPETPPTPDQAGPKPKWSLGKFDKYLPTCIHATWLIKICNFLLIIAVNLYCLTLLMTIKISLVGRLGGINHICRAFFRSLFLVAIITPWQQIMPGLLVGAVYTPAQLLCSGAAPAPIGCIVMYFLRFTGLWLLAFYLLCSAQCRSKKWSKATLKRQGILQ